MTTRIDSTTSTESASDSFPAEALTTAELPPAIEAPVEKEAPTPLDADGQIDPQKVLVSLVLPSDLSGLLAMKIRGTEEERNHIVTSMIGPAFGVSWKVFDSFAHQYDPALDESVSRLSGIVRSFSSTVRGIFGNLGRVAIRFMEQTRESLKASRDDDRLTEPRLRQVAQSFHMKGSAQVADGQVQTTEHVETTLIDGQIKTCVTHTVTTFEPTNKPKDAVR